MTFRAKYEALTPIRYTGRMFGFRYSRLFKSRWAALLWAAGILFSAWSYASDQPSTQADADADAVSNVQMAAIANAF